MGAGEIVGSTFSLGSAIGSSLGRLMLALTAFVALGVSIPALSGAGALLAWWSRTTLSARLRPSVQP